MRKIRRKTKVTWIALAFYVSGIIAAINAVMTTRTAPGAIAWSVSLVSFPFVAVPAYLVFGRNKFEGMAEAVEQNQAEIDALTVEFRNNLQPWAVPDNESLPESATNTRGSTWTSAPGGTPMCAWRGQSLCSFRRPSFLTGNGQGLTLLVSAVMLFLLIDKSPLLTETMVSLNRAILVAFPASFAAILVDSVSK